MPLRDEKPIKRQALDFAVTEVGQLGGSLVKRSSDDAEILLPVRLADGQTLTYRLTLSMLGTQLRVREKVPTLLPASCPNRHINPNGTFCVTWAKRRAIEVVDSSSALDWWFAIYRFLQEQHRAKKKRRWPTKDDWAHGDAAAEQQMRSELAAETLGPPFPKLLRSGKLKVVKKGHFLRLLGARAERLYSVWIDYDRVATLRQYCFCRLGQMKKTVLRGCSDHAKAAADLVLGIAGREREEEAFWKSVSDQPCCGTLDSCPLKR